MKKLTFILLSALFLMQTTAVSAAVHGDSQPFARWVIYHNSNTGSTELTKAVNKFNAEALKSRQVLAIYGGEDQNGNIRFLEIYKNKNSFDEFILNNEIQKIRQQIKATNPAVKIMDTEIFNLASKFAGQADKARMARLVIDPLHLEEYKQLLAEEMNSSVANEDGVLALLATTETDNPNIFHLLELYRDDEAYTRHITGQYFQKYNHSTKNMIKDKTLIVNKPQMITVSGKSLN